MSDEQETIVNDEGELIFQLTTRFDYSKAGEQLNASFISCTAPSSNEMRECARLKQAFFRALPDGGESDTDADANPDDLDMAGVDVMTMIAQSEKVDLFEVFEVGRKLLASGVGKVDGETKLTDPLIKKISLDDLESLIGEYLVNFVLASSLERMKTKLSEASST